MCTAVKIFSRKGDEKIIGKIGCSLPDTFFEFPGKLRWCRSVSRTRETWWSLRMLLELSENLILTEWSVLFGGSTGMVFTGLPRMQSNRHDESLTSYTHRGARKDAWKRCWPSLPDVYSESSAPRWRGGFYQPPSRRGVSEARRSWSNHVVHGERGVNDFPPIRGFHPLRRVESSLFLFPRDAALNFS